MTVQYFGFATPLSFNKLSKGMLVLATPNSGGKFFGVVSKINHDFILVILAASDGENHAAIDLGHAVDNLWLIPGTLEIEPAGEPFIDNHNRTNNPSYIINSDGHIGSQFLYTNDFRKHQMYVVDLNTGEHLERAEKNAGFKDAKLYIRQEGREDRIPWPVLTQDQ